MYILLATINRNVTSVATVSLPENSCERSRLAEDPGVYRRRVLSDLFV
jgi:hypothetical protein